MKQLKDSNQAPTKSHANSTLLLTPQGGALFFHAQYTDISRATIRKAFNECCPKLQSEISIAQFTIAYSRQPNLRDKLKTKPTAPPGQRASDSPLTLLPPVPEPTTNT